MLPGTRSLFIVLAVVTLAGSRAEATALATMAGRVEVGVASFRELREARLVRQGWDISCGSAALSTILTYHFDDPYTEATIALSILRNTDPERVRARGGFSLLDLSRFAEAVGYVTRGYGEMTLADLEQQPVPAILPVRFRDYDHFVVFRGRAGDRVLIGDPAFGNLTLTLAQFEEAWSSGIGFFVYADEQQAALRGAETASPLDPNALNVLLPNTDYIQRISRGAGPVPPTRRVQPRLPGS